MTAHASRQRLAAPASVAGAAVAAGVTLYLRDPRTSSYLPCPFHAVTGLWCPACGATRAFGDLVRGDVPSAMSSNVLAVVSAVVAVVVWVLWVSARVRGRDLALRRPAGWVIASGVSIMLVFTVFRNIPAGSWLAP